MPEADSMVTTSGLQERLLDRQEVCVQLTREGYDVKPRTLRYWAQQGLIPKPERLGRKAVYRDDDLDAIRLLAATRPKQVAQLRRRALRSTKSSPHYDLSISGDTITLRINYREAEND